MASGLDQITLTRAAREVLDLAEDCGLSPRVGQGGPGGHGRGQTSVWVDSGMRNGLLALSASDGATLVAWKNKDVLGWQLYNAKGQPQGESGSANSSGSGAAPASREGLGPRPAISTRHERDRACSAPRRQPFHRAVLREGRVNRADPNRHPTARCGRAGRLRSHAWEPPFYVGGWTCRSNPAMPVGCVVKK